jgi:hypothetical protein
MAQALSNRDAHVDTGVGPVASTPDSGEGPEGEAPGGVVRRIGSADDRPRLTDRYIALIFRQHISRRLTEGMALECLTAANLACASQG